jgi:hypothetical protein
MRPIMQVIEEPIQKELINSLEVVNFGKTLIDMKIKSIPDTHAVRKTMFPESGFAKREKKSANMITTKFMFTRNNNFLLSIN